jgi:crotonobetainyl-CoA:carnitine CoA-transferase CaiB-like acyl-CoA transferase
MVPFRFASRKGRAWMHCPSPTLGEHNDEILGGELGLSEADLSALRDAALIGERPAGT